jgi:hypothetical protein
LTPPISRDARLTSSRILIIEYEVGRSARARRAALRVGRRSCRNVALSGVTTPYLE